VNAIIASFEPLTAIIGPTGGLVDEHETKKNKNRRLTMTTSRMRKHVEIIPLAD